MPSHRRVHGNYSYFKNLFLFHIYFKILMGAYFCIGGIWCMIMIVICGLYVILYYQKIKNFFCDIIFLPTLGDDRLMLLQPLIFLNIVLICYHFLIILNIVDQLIDITKECMTKIGVVKPQWGLTRLRLKSCDLIKF